MQNSIHRPGVDTHMRDVSYIYMHAALHCNNIWVILTLEMLPQLHLVSGSWLCCYNHNNGTVKCIRLWYATSVIVMIISLVSCVFLFLYSYHIPAP